MSSAAGNTARRYIEALVDLRRQRGLSKKELAEKIGRDPSYVSHIEAGRHRPTAEFTWRADNVLAGQGRLMEAFEQYWQALHGPRLLASARTAEPPGVELVVEHEESAVRLDASGYYHVTLARRVRNVSDQPLIYFPTRIAADAYPDDAACSTAFYQHHPVSVESAQFWATINGEPTVWRTARDRPAYKKIRIEFAPGGSPQPLYRDQVAEVACGYRLHCSQWGDWFGREVRWPTRRMSVSLTFPRDFGARPAGLEMSWTADRRVLLSTESGPDYSLVTYRWTKDAPVLATQYRFTWAFNRAPAHRRAIPAQVHHHEGCTCAVPAAVAA